jgi:hypothetical protein
MKALPPVLIARGRTTFLAELIGESEVDDREKDSRNHGKS